MSNSPSGAGASLEQAQFLRILTREEAIAAFDAALQPHPLGMERVELAALGGRVLAKDVAAPVDTPPFDRAVVDGFAIRAADVAAAAPGAPVRLQINPEVIACGTVPALAVTAGSATPIATGGPLPRGADAVVMIEHTEPAEAGALHVLRPVSPGQNIAFAGSDIAQGQTLLRRGTLIGAREIAMLAAVGLGAVEVWRKPRVAVLSTGDELVQPGETLHPAGVYDSNGPAVAAALEENGCIALRLGAVADDPTQLRAAITEAFVNADALILSGGTSKGAGDLTCRIVAELGEPGIIAHGVALKPGKPLCLAVCEGKPVVVLPGFPTSAMFTFHDIVVPFLRRLAGLPARKMGGVEARLAGALASEAGRTEFVMVALSQDAAGLVAHPVGKGSGAVTAFSQADGFLRVEALAENIPAESTVTVQLFTPHLAIPDLVIMGSHCVGLDAVVGHMAASARVITTGSLGGLAALRRDACDLAPIHLMDPGSGRYNTPFLSPGMRLIPGWKRLQGLVFRRGDMRFEGRSIPDAVAAALGDPACIMVNRNQGAGTRTLIDALLAGHRPPGYWNQPRSHNAVAAAIAQARADWGVAIRPVAEAQGLAFLPLAHEHYDFATRITPRNASAVAAFEEALAEAGAALLALGFEPA
jgi:putative molybdopterin biosynthesis protein